MKCSVVSYSLSEDPENLDEWKNNLKVEINNFIENGSRVILYPELFLMGVYRYFKSSSPMEDIRNVAEFISNDLLPELKMFLDGKEVLLVLGTGPHLHGGKVFNTAPILHKGEWLFQNKLFLTPWETDFSPGEELLCFEFDGLKTAVVVCFDSEQPDLAMKLKNEFVDMILVPSATMTRNGNNRVNRCASARAIELGALVITSPLVGDSPCDLVDHNEGRQGFFLPAQEEITIQQEYYSEYSAVNKVITHYEIDENLLKNLKTHTLEAKPFLQPVHPKLSIKLL